MRKAVLLLSVLLFVFSTKMAFSADVQTDISINDSMSLAKVKELFPGDVAFYWGDQAHPPVESTIGNYKASRKTNGLGKSREDACAWAMAAALGALQDRARKEGGDAVINIVSNLNNYPSSSEATYKCLAGRVMVAVALKGDVVKLAK